MSDEQCTHSALLNLAWLLLRQGDERVDTHERVALRMRILSLIQELRTSPELVHPHHTRMLDTLREQWRERCRPATRPNVH